VADINLSIDVPASIQEVTTHRVRVFGYGDGYQQIAADGINTRGTSYEFTTKPLSPGDASAFKTDLDNVAVGDFFLATLSPFVTEERRYRLADNTYTRSVLAGPSANEVFQFTLIESFA